jgi:hypothetical protein
LFVTDYTVCAGAEHAHGGGGSNAQHAGTSAILNTVIAGRGMDVADDAIEPLTKNAVTWPNGLPTRWQQLCALCMYSVHAIRICHEKRVVRSRYAQNKAILVIASVCRDEQSSVFAVVDSTDDHVVIRVAGSAHKNLRSWYEPQ